MNCDQVLPTLSTECLLNQLYIDRADGTLLVFTNDSPKWSFVRLNSHGFICDVAEKSPISNLANTGVFLWKYGSDFVKYAQELIINNDRFNGEFYTSMIFNYMIKDSKIIKAYYTNQMWGTGTIEDIENYEKYLKERI